MEMAVTIIVRLSLKREHVDEFEEDFNKNLPDTIAYEGCHSLTVYRNQDDPTEIVVVERWESKQHYETYLSWRYEMGKMDVLLSFFSAPPEINYFDSIWSNDR
jgi:quinol monooxygenase YgiN